MVVRVLRFQGPRPMRRRSPLFAYFIFLSFYLFYLLRIGQDEDREPIPLWLPCPRVSAWGESLLHLELSASGEDWHWDLQQCSTCTSKLYIPPHFHLSLQFLCATSRAGALVLICWCAARHHGARPNWTLSVAFPSRDSLPDYRRVYRWPLLRESDYGQQHLLVLLALPSCRMAI